MRTFWWSRSALALAVVACGGACASSSPAPEDAVVCTLEARSSFPVTVVDSTSGAPIRSGATVGVTEGPFADTLLAPGPGASAYSGGVYERPGTYTVAVAAPAGATDVWAGVRVVSDPVGPYDSGTSTTYPEPPPPNDGTYTTGGPGQPAEPPPGDPATNEGTYEAPPPPYEEPAYAEPDWYYQF
jgi:hypothetical protein